ncbi:MAG: 50S ribosomal protein L21 [bacterium]|nr:50S ribosomal protein L21 [bacterium]
MVENKKVAGKGEFAVIATGGKQYKVSVGEVISIEKMKGEFKEGDKVTFDKVLMVDDGKDATIGAPYIKEAKVLGTIKEIGKKPKVMVVKYKAKSRYLKTRGHRQPFFKVEITALK